APRCGTTERGAPGGRERPPRGRPPKKRGDQNPLRPPAATKKSPNSSSAALDSKTTGASRVVTLRALSFRKERLAASSPNASGESRDASAHWRSPQEATCIWPPSFAIGATVNAQVVLWYSPANPALVTRMVFLTVVEQAEPSEFVMRGSAPRAASSAERAMSILRSVVSSPTPGSYKPRSAVLCANPSRARGGGAFSVRSSFAVLTARGDQFLIVLGVC